MGQSLSIQLRSDDSNKPSLNRSFYSLLLASAERLSSPDKEAEPQAIPAEVLKTNRNPMFGRESLTGLSLSN
jgi:hypothetical protein